MYKQLVLNGVCVCEFEYFEQNNRLLVSEYCVESILTTFHIIKIVFMYLTTVITTIV